MNTDEENELCTTLSSVIKGQKIVDLPYTVGTVFHQMQCVLLSIFSPHVVIHDDDDPWDIP